MILKTWGAVYLALPALDSVVSTSFGAKSYLQLLFAKEMAQDILAFFLILVLTYLIRYSSLLVWAAAVGVDFLYFQLFGAASPAYLEESKRMHVMLRRWLGPSLRVLHFSSTLGCLVLGVILIPWRGSVEEVLRTLGVLFVVFVAIVPFLVFGQCLWLALRARPRHQRRPYWRRFERFVLSRECLKHSLKSILFFTVLTGLLGRVMLPGGITVMEIVEHRISSVVATACKYRQTYAGLVDDGFDESAILHRWARVPEPDSEITGLRIADAGDYIRDPTNEKTFLNWLFFAATITVLVAVALPAVLSALRDARAREVVKSVAKSTLVAACVVGIVQIVVDVLFLVNSARFLTIGFYFTVVLSFHLALGASTYDEAGSQDSVGSGI